MAIQFPIYFGKSKKYWLSERSFHHIIDGEFAIRPSTDSTGKKLLEQVLKGGLHTYMSWKNFRHSHPCIVPLQEYDTDVHKDWFFARELQNGVVALKIPRHLFTGSAANITKKPDLHYKSGYLWKTLYPIKFSVEDILSTIEEALDNIDQEDSSFPSHVDARGVIYGYARTDRPFEAIRLRIQLHGCEIKSAFPSWEQPMTGNNGKPYSHEHSIGFQISASTVAHEKTPPPNSAIFPNGKFDLDALVRITPDFTLTRDKPIHGVIQDTWHASRMCVLREIANNSSEDEIAKIVKYLKDYVISKEPCFLQAKIYEHHLDEIDNNLTYFNAAQLIQNILESCWVLSFSDQKRGSMYAIHCIARFLTMAVVHTGGFNSLQYKRLFGAFLDIATEHHGADSVKNVIEALSISPSRIALYTEFNLNPYVKTNDEKGLSIIGITSVSLALNAEHFFDYLSLNLGENYLLNFNKAQRLNIAKEIWKARNSERMIADSLAYCVGADYDFFIPAKYDPNNMIDSKAVPSEMALKAIAKDYGRMLIIYRQRVVMEDANAHIEELNFDDFGSQRYFEITRQKHKRSYIQFMHEQMLDCFIKFAEIQEYENLQRSCQHALSALPKEHVPLPKPIPDYIQSWQSTINSKDSGLDKQAMMEKIFGA